MIGMLRSRLPVTDRTARAFVDLAVALVVIAAWLSFGSVALGGSCGRVAVCSPVVHQAAVVHHAPIVHEAVVHKAVAVVDHTPPVQNFFYSVGQPVAQQAVMQQAMKAALSEYQFKAQIDLNGSINGSVTGQTNGGVGAAAGVAAPAYGSPAGSTAPPQFSFTAPSTGGAVNGIGANGGGLEQHCAQCHRGAGAKGGFNVESHTPEQAIHAAREVRDGTMPPSGPLSIEQKLATYEDLLGQ